MWPFKNDNYVTEEELRLRKLEKNQTCVKCGHIVATDRTVSVECTSAAAPFTTDGRRLSTWEYYCEEHAPPYRKVVDYSCGAFVAYTRDRIERTHYRADGMPYHKEYMS